MNKFLYSICTVLFFMGFDVLALLPTQQLNGFNIIVPHNSFLKKYTNVGLGSSFSEKESYLKDIYIFYKQGLVQKDVSKLEKIENDSKEHKNNTEQPTARNTTETPANTPDFSNEKFGYKLRKSPESNPEKRTEDLQENKLEVVKTDQQDEFYETAEKIYTTEYEFKKAVSNLADKLREYAQEYRHCKKIVAAYESDLRWNDFKPSKDHVSQVEECKLIINKIKKVVHEIVLQFNQCMRDADLTNDLHPNTIKKSTIKFYVKSFYEKLKILDCDDDNKLYQEYLDPKKSAEKDTGWFWSWFK